MSLWNVQLMAPVPIAFRFCLPKENTGLSGIIDPNRDSSRCKNTAISEAIFGPKGTRRSFPNFVWRMIRTRASRSMSFRHRARYLSDAKPESVQDRKDHLVNLSAGQCSRIARQLGRRIEKASRLVDIKEKWPSSCCDAPTFATQRRLLQHLVHHQPI